MPQEPEWLTKAKAAGLVTERGVNVPALTAAGGPVVDLPGPHFEFRKEEEFQAEVIKLARVLGWRVAHFRRVRVMRKDGTMFFETPVAADGKGFLDLELVRERLVKAELKIKGGRLKPEQKEWITHYQKIGVEVYVWFPRDWQTIREVLK